MIITKTLKRPPRKSIKHSLYTVFFVFIFGVGFGIFMGYVISSGLFDKLMQYLGMLAY